jgi:hypothetical protein
LGQQEKILDVLDTRIPESVLKGDGDAALEELGPALDAVIYERSKKLVVCTMISGRNRFPFRELLAFGNRS